LLELSTTEWPLSTSPASDQPPAASRDILRWVPYEPEFDRYGGAKAMPVAEDCFWISSRVAIDVMRNTTSGRSARMGQSLLCMLVFIHVFGGAGVDAAAYGARYESGNLRAFARDEGSDTIWVRAFDNGFAKQAESIEPFIGETWERLQSDTSLSPALDELRDGLVATREGLESLCKSGELIHFGRRISLEGAFHYIVPSYIHMMNNRLGLTIADEAYLAHLIARSLSEKATTESGLT
jgi:thiopeptide-type bacteriocin biosynthesis protein